MAQVYNKIYVDVRTETTDIVTAVQKDANSRFLDVYLKDNGLPINLTGHKVRIYGKKYDGTEIYNDGEITEATNGRCQFELADQALALAQDLEVQIVIYYNNVQILQSFPFTIHVKKSLISTNAIESSNEYGALVVLYQNLHEAYDLMTTMVQNQGVKSSVSTDRNVETFWQVMEYVASYMDTDLTDLLQLTLGAVSNTGAMLEDGMMFLPSMQWAPVGIESLVQSGYSDSIFEKDNVLYYADKTSKKVIAFNSNNLKKIGETAVQTGVGRSIYVEGGIIYYSDETAKKVITFNATTLAKISETAVQTGYGFSIIVDNGVLYYASSAKKVITFNATTLAKISETAVQTGNAHCIRIQDGILYYPDATSYKIIAFDANTLAKINESDAQGEVIYSICTDSEYVYGAGIISNKVMAFDKNTLVKIRETQSQSGRILADLGISGGIIYYADETSKKVIAFKASDLKSMGESQAQSGAADALFANEKGVYLSTSTVYKGIYLDNRFVVSHYERRDKE